MYCNIKQALLVTVYMFGSRKVNAISVVDSQYTQAFNFLPARTVAVQLVQVVQDAQERHGQRGVLHLKQSTKQPSESS